MNETNENKTQAQQTTEEHRQPSRLSRDTRENALRDVAWVAEFLGVSKSWVYQATATGGLPCIRLGSSLRFEKGAIERWLQGEKTKSVSLPGCR